MSSLTLSLSLSSQHALAASGASGWLAALLTVAPPATASSPARAPASLIGPATAFACDGGQHRQHARDEGPPQSSLSSGRQRRDPRLLQTRLTPPDGRALGRCCDLGAVLDASTLPLRLPQASRTSSIPALLRLCPLSHGPPSLAALCCPMRWLCWTAGGPVPVFLSAVLTPQLIGRDPALSALSSHPVALRRHR